jgi:transketolase
MRNALIDTIIEIDREDPSNVFITGDLGFMAVEPLIEIMGKRFINAGVAEANIIGMAAGLSKIGYKPFLYSMIPFISTRCLEQIRVTLCQNNNNAVILGVASGYSYGNQGPSHHAIEDLASMLSLPNMSVIVPADPWDVKNSLRATRNLHGPVYIRLAKVGEAVIEIKDRTFEFGKITTLKDGKDAAILTFGEITGKCVNIARKLEKDGYSVAVYNCHTLKPFDEGKVLEIAPKIPFLFTVEQHVLHGGLASMVATTLMKNNCQPRAFVPFHIPDRYAPCCGSKEFLEDLDGLSEDKMYSKMHSVITRSKA